MEISCATRARPGGPNEDYVLVGPDIAVLLDGAGVPAEAETGCLHGVQWYVQRLAYRLVGGAADSETPLTAALADAIQATTDDHRDTCDVGHTRSPSSTVVAVRIGPEHLEWLVLGDSTLILIDADGPTAVSDRRLDEIARRGRAALASRSAARDQDSRWVGLVDEERAARNREGGYWIAADDPVAAQHALTGSRPMPGIREVMLASDGATRPVDRFGVHDWCELVDAVERDGPADYLRTVRNLETSDPDGERWPRAKTHDDATLALLQL